MTTLPSGTVTFLFTDIEGSTRLLHGLGERYRPLLDEHHRIIRGAVEDHGGALVQTIGDGAFAAFANATAAVSAAVAAQRALRAHEWPSDGVIRVRMGLHSGEATPEDGAYVSLAVHHAARVGDTGHGGQVVLSDTTRALLDGAETDFSFRDLGPHRLKDLTSAVRLHQVCHPDLHDGFPPLRSLDQVPHNLPVQLTTFVGRDDELVEVTKLVSDDRLVTLTGAGGSGKTRLALQVAADIAQDFDGGVWLVELAAVVDPDAVEFAVADAMHVRAEPGRSPRDLLRERLKGPATLVLLDNCEHVLGAATDLTADILSVCPDAKVLATSREPLGVPGETVWRIPSMSTRDVFGEAFGGDAVRLFLERAGHVRPDWTPKTDAERAAVIEICERLDGIPLAIELAAARLDVLDVEQIRTRLHDRFRLLTGGSRVTLERQRTLRAAVDWSYALLDDAGRVLLRRLAVFVGSFTLEAAETVCADETAPAEDVLDLLGDLVRKSLVVDDRSRTPRRYSTLETIRQYAREALMDAGEAGVVQAAHYDWALALASQAWGRKDFVGFDWFGWVGALDAEHDNMIAALTWAADNDDPAQLDALLYRIYTRWSTLGHYNLAAHWVDVALGHPGARPDYVRGRLLLAESQVVFRLGDHARARAAYDEAVPLLADDPEPKVHIWKLQGEAFLLGHEEEFERGRQVNEEAIELARAHGDRVAEAALLSNHSSVMFRLGDGQAALALLEQARSVAREANAPLALAWATSNLVSGRAAFGDRAEADALADDARELVERVGENILLGSLLSWQFLRAATRDLAKADAIAHEQLALARRTGLTEGEVAALDNVGTVAWVRGDLATPARLWREAYRKWLPTVKPDTPSVGLLGYVLMVEGDIDGAAALAEESYRGLPGDDILLGCHVATMRRDAATLRRWVERAEAQLERLGITQRPPIGSVVHGILGVLEGDLAAARAEFAAAIALEVDDAAPQYVLDAVDGLGAVYAADGDAEAAGACFGLTSVVREATEMRNSTMGVETIAADGRAAAEAADPDAFAHGFGRGQAAGVDGFFALATELAALT